jgi:uncharacterized LabA/DUF88 family protein
MPDEVAMFIDLENLRYGMLNNHGQEPNFQQLLEKAKKYGRPSTMRAYADFSEHPDQVTRELQIAGIEAINIPVKRYKVTRGGQTVERVKNAADMILALDAMAEAVEADRTRESKVFLLVAGDRDYIRLAALVRNRFGQRVVVAGVPGSVSPDLVKAAGQEDPVDVVPHTPVDKHVLKSAIVAMVKKGPTAPLTFWTVRILEQWCSDPRQSIPGILREHRDAMHELLNEGVLTRREIQFKNRQAMEAVLDEAKARELGYLH